MHWGSRRLPRLLLNYQAQLYASNLWRSGDFDVLTLTHGDTEIGRIDSASLTMRSPVGGAWRLAPRLTVERLGLHLWRKAGEVLGIHVAGVGRAGLAEEWDAHPSATYQRTRREWDW